MMYPFMTLSDETEIVHSDMQNDGRVKVYIERPDEKYGFKHAACWLPDYTWEDIYHFSEEEIKQFEEIIRSTAHLIIEFSQEAMLMCHKAILNILFCFKVYAKVNCSGGDSRGTACPASYGRYENIVLSQLELNRLKAAGSVAVNNIENVFSKTQEIR